MNPNHCANTQSTQQPHRQVIRQCTTGTAAYLLNMAPIPPPTQQDYAVAVLNHALDGGRLREEEESSNEDENIDPQLRPQSQPQVAVAPTPGKSIFWFSYNTISWI